MEYTQKYFYYFRVFVVSPNLRISIKKVTMYLCPVLFVRVSDYLSVFIRLFLSKNNILSIFRAFRWTLFLKSRGVRRSMVLLCAEARFRPRTSDLFNQLFYKRNATVGSKRRANTGTDCSNPQQTYDIYNIKTTDKRGSFPINH